MSSNLFKQNSVVIKKSDEPRVIDSNDIIAARIQKLTEILEMDSEPDFTELEFDEGFRPGLEAQQVDALLGDRDAEADINLDNAYAEAKRVIDEANESASAIIEEANSRADSIMDNAAAELEQLKQNAFDEGHSEGYEAGYNEGMATISSMEKELADKESEMIELYNRKLDSLESELVETFTNIYEHVLSTKLSDESKIIYGLIDNVIHGVEGGKNFLVHVSKSDYEYVNERKEELKRGLGSSDTIEVIEDMTLSASMCFIEADTGIYDCSLDTQLKALSKELRSLSYS